MKTPRAWYRFQNVADDPSVVDIHVIDLIGDWIDELINEFWGVKATLTAKAFIDQLSKLEAPVKTIRVHINSPGGDVFAAVTIANALRDQQLTKGRSVETIIDGLAASAASIIAMAGQTVRMADNALLMIHKPLTGIWGNATELRAAATELDKIELNAIVATYKWHSTLSDKKIAALLTGENGVDGTWMGVDEALAAGFVTDKIEGLAVAASISANAIGALKVPDRFRAQVNAFLKPESPAPAPVAALEIVKACNAAECPELAEELIAGGATAEQLQARVGATKTEKAAATARATEITAVCAAAKRPRLAAGYIAGGMTLEGVKAHLTIITAEADQGEIDTGLPPNAASRPAGGGAVIDTEAVYAARNRKTA